ncbi:MAG: FKBP-type peptidyl-prolyl cis-trans isomerase [Thermoplasmata archaeon]|nr:FKBP-type peptidyl-prolyl cis-trans isomerase [Thermoplasmata archaeon]
MPPKKTKPKDESQTNDTEKPESKKSPGKSNIVAGDVLTLDFDAWIMNQDGTEELFDTTNEEHAKAGDIFNEKATYEPIVTIVGDGRVLAGLDKSFLTAAIGVKSTVLIPPAEGAGERQLNMVEVFAVRELQKQDIEPEPGMRIQIKNRVGTITNMTSGRVRVDFNDPLAGKDLKYDYTIIKKANNLEEKVLGIIDADYRNSSEFKASVKEDVLELTLADMCKYDQAWFTLKYKVVSDLRQFLDIKTIRFVEEYVKKEEPKEEAPKEEAKAEEKKPEAPEPVVEKAEEEL